jgi:DnaJ-class molecular chaperone
VSGRPGLNQGQGTRNLLKNKQHNTAAAHATRTQLSYSTITFVWTPSPVSNGMSCSECTGEGQQKRDHTPPHHTKEHASCPSCNTHKNMRTRPWRKETTSCPPGT